MKQLRRGYMRKVDREAFLNSMREIDIHKSLQHESVVKLFEVIDDTEDDKVYLIMEAASNG
jgi:serine/threonine protein kinase